MKKTTLIALVLLLGSSWLSAQNFYVALVKGEVYYQDQLLKPRDKVTLEGEFRFTSSDDFVKITGPTGIHTIRPVEKPGGGWEFILAVTEELFPAPRLLSTSVLSANYCPGDIMRLYCPNEYTAGVFFDGEERELDWDSRGFRPAEVHYLFQTTETGIQLRPASTTAESYVIRRADFALASPTDEMLNDLMYIVAVNDLPEFERLITQANENGGWETLLPAIAITEERFDYLAVGSYTAQNPTVGEQEAASVLRAQMADYSEQQGWSERTALPIQELGYWRPATHLSELSPSAVIDSEPLMGDAYFVFKHSGYDSFFEFMIGLRHDGETYAPIVREQYGAMDFRAIVDYFDRYYLPKKRWEEMARRMAPSIIRGGN